VSIRTLRPSDQPNIDNLNWPPDGAPCLLELPRLALSSLKVLVYEHAEDSRGRHHLVQQAESLRLRQTVQQADAGGVSTRQQTANDANANEPAQIDKLS
jgi:hypothetical protein